LKGLFLIATLEKVKDQEKGRSLYEEKAMDPKREKKRLASDFFLPSTSRELLELSGERKVKNAFKIHQLFSHGVPLRIGYSIGGLLTFSAQSSPFLAIILNLKISKRLLHLFDVSFELQLLRFGEI